MAADGAVTWRVRFRLYGAQTTETFADEPSAVAFVRSLAEVGAYQALRRLYDEPGGRRRRRGVLATWRPARPTAPLRAAPQRWEDYADDYAMLRREGYPLNVIAGRLGMTPAAVDRALVRHRSDDRARRP